MQIFKCTFGQCLVDFHLTLPPEILPVHLPAQPAWTPGPGIFHYGTAEGRSRPAKDEEEDKSQTVIGREHSQNVKHKGNPDQKPQNDKQVSTQAGQS